MSGRFLKCFLILLLWSASSLHAAESDSYGEISVNGHLMLDLTGDDSDGRLGLRNKAMGDRLLNLEEYYDAIRYYEEAAIYLPTEADIYFNLGNCYYFLAESSVMSAKPGIYDMAIEYYETAIEIYEYPENAGKSLQNYYLALIRKCFSMAESTDDHTEANSFKVDVIIPLEDDIYDDYPTVGDELDELYDLLHVGWVDYFEED